MVRPKAGGRGVGWSFEGRGKVEEGGVIAAKVSTTDPLRLHSVMSDTPRGRLIATHSRLNDIWMSVAYC